MIHKVKQFIKDNHLFTPEDKLLVAISGGMDSVCLAHVLKDLGYSIVLVHCNFQLRGEESISDEKFVRHLAIDLDCEVQVKRFEIDTKSVQLQARNLRYDWFSQLQKEKEAFLLTAHHKSDVLETFLINLGRGTGLEGLHGILPKNDRNVIRPFLSVTRTEIEEYCKGNKIEYREDSSNSSNAYVRNKLRHNVIPALKEVFPDIEERLWDTTSRVKESEDLLKANVALNWEDCISMKDRNTRINIEKVSTQETPIVFLYEALKSHGFSKYMLIDLWEAKLSGAKVQSASHILYKDREDLILSKIEPKANNLYEIAVKNATIETVFGKVKVEVDANLPDHKSITKQECYLDIEKLHFPLALRKWEQGDKFKPLGMKGFKKISDFLIDKKIPLASKDSIWVLCSQEEIVWVLNHRLDDRFKVTQETEEVLKLEIVS
jgi:tRNA(Ile)-lysidine synthase